MMKAEDVMTMDVVTVSPDTPVKDAIERMLRSDVSGLPVVDAEGRLVGMVTEADVMAKAAYGSHRRRALGLVADLLSGRDLRWVTKSAGLTVAEVMSSHPVVCGRGDEIPVVARRMLQRGVKRMPVVEDGLLRGVVSRQDVLAIFDRSDAAVAEDVERVLASDSNMPDDRHVRSSVEDGVVTLSGDVRYEWDEVPVVSIVRAVPGVLDVVSHLHHRERNPRTSSDAWSTGTMWPLSGRR
jgi:CBS domain-containing protein